MARHAKKLPVDSVFLRRDGRENARPMSLLCWVDKVYFCLTEISSSTGAAALVMVYGSVLSSAFLVSFQTVFALSLRHYYPLTLSANC